MANEINKRPLAIIFIALLVIGAGAGWIYRQDKTAPSLSEPPEKAATAELGTCTVDKDCASPTPAVIPGVDAGASGTQLSSPVAPSTAAPGASSSGSQMLSSPAPSPAPSPGPSPVSAGQLQETFRELAANTQRLLPTFEKFKGLSSEEAHGVPQVIRDAGVRLGAIAQNLTEHPELAPEGIQFYQDCYKRSDLVQQVRALCLADYRHWRKQLKQDSMAEDLSGVPAQVTDLAAKIPN